MDFVAASGTEDGARAPATGGSAFVGVAGGTGTTGRRAGAVLVAAVRGAA
jgi:hypothetical protein